MFSRNKCDSCLTCIGIKLNGWNLFRLDVSVSNKHVTNVFREASLWNTVNKQFSAAPFFLLWKGPRDRFRFTICFEVTLFEDMQCNTSIIHGIVYIRHLTLQYSHGKILQTTRSIRLIFHSEKHSRINVAVMLHFESRQVILQCMAYDYCLFGTQCQHESLCMFQCELDFIQMIFSNTIYPCPMVHHRPIWFDQRIDQNLFRVDSVHNTQTAKGFMV
mmetsp:Transcript_10704/g.20008  ORF Transcript_10704/g.20008 Transcript_10704/m.20008 type:complete len:217 (+) Transcript_10704:265-915(+)